MTLCIAALCQEDGKPRVVASFDRRVETAIAGADTELKFESLSPHWGALLAGDVALARELLLAYGALFDKTDQFDHYGILRELRGPANEFRDDLADRLVRSRLAMSLDDLKKRGQKNLPPDVYRQIWFEIESQDLGVELILFGWHDDSFRLFKLRRNGRLEFSEPFAAIGSGSVIASSALYQRQYTERWRLAPALYAVFEAQALGSIAPGVGRDPTEAYTVGFYYDKKAKEVDYLYPSDQTEAWLSNQFKKFGPRTIPETLTLPEKPFSDDSKS